jgi:hypothetical protein
MILKIRTGNFGTWMIVGGLFLKCYSHANHDLADTVITLANWYDRSSIEIASVIPPTYQATLINGMGRNFERYSVIFYANKEPTNYWNRAVSNTATPKFDPDSTDSFKGGINSAMLRYARANKVDPIT